MAGVRWVCGVVGLLVGAVAGAVLGNWVAEQLPKNRDLGDLGYGLVVVFIGLVAGAVAGGILGWLACRGRPGERPPA